MLSTPFTNLRKTLIFPFIGLLKIYKWCISPMLGCNCRFLPSCSEYSMEALSQHGISKGSWLTIKRICRCHPWGRSGFDPVPLTTNSNMTR